MNKPRLLLESYVPYVPDGIRGYFDVEVVAPENIGKELLSRFDAMIVRTRTRCNAALLEGTPVEFVATATIGTDHIDLPYCASRGIEVASAPGCNAPAVSQYVFASLLTEIRTDIAPDERLRGLTLGVVGVGHVGKIVADWGEKLGMNVLRCDPPRAEAEGPSGFVPLDEVAAKADVVTFHVPHTRIGEHATHHIAGTDFFSKLRRGAVVINASRGPIVDTPALVAAIDGGIVGKAIIDTWEGEPSISRELLERTVIATPHIAGYSKNGKIRAAKAATDALCRHFGVQFDFDPGIPAGAIENVTAGKIMRSYDPMVDDRILRASPADFERLRNTYKLRPEVE